MFSRYFLAICSLVLLASALGIQAEEITAEEQRVFELVLQKKIEEAIGDKNVAVYNYKSFLSELLDLLKKFVDDAARNCVVQIVETCGKNPKFLLCVKNYVKQDKGRCALPEKKQEIDVLSS